MRGGKNTGRVQKRYAAPKVEEPGADEYVRTIECPTT